MYKKTLFFKKTKIGLSSLVLTNPNFINYSYSNKYNLPLDYSQRKIDLRYLIIKKKLKNLNYLFATTKTEFPLILESFKKSRIDWHSKELMTKNHLGLWFSYCFQPFSTRKYWWILLPSQNLLFRLRWETLSQSNASRNILVNQINNQKFQSLNWFSEKPLYMYCILPFFGCLNLISISLAKENSPILETIGSNKNRFSQYSLYKNYRNSQSNNLNAPKINLVSWETLNYLSYKKKLLDLSFKFIKKLNCYHDSIIYEVSPSWFHYLQEQYIGFYPKRGFSNIKQNYNILLDQNTQKNRQNLSIKMKKNKFEINNNFQTKSSKFKNLKFWWKQEGFSNSIQQFASTVINTKALDKKEKIKPINFLQRSTLLKQIQTKTLKTSTLKFFKLKKHQYVWNSFLFEKSKLKWCWYKLSINQFQGNIFQYNQFLNPRFSPHFLWENYVGNLNYELKLNKTNFIKLLNTNNFYGKEGLKKKNPPFLSFQQFRLLGINFDDFAQKMLVSNISIPLNYLSFSSKNSTILEVKNFSICKYLQQINYLKKNKPVQFNVKKTIWPIYSKKSNYLNSFLKNRKVNFNQSLIGINSTNRILDQIKQTTSLSKSFLNKTSGINKNELNHQDFYLNCFSLRSGNSTFELYKRFGFLNKFESQKKEKEILNKVCISNSDLLKQIQKKNYNNIENDTVKNEKSYSSYIVENYLKTLFIYDTLFYKLFNYPENLVLKNQTTTKTYMFKSIINNSNNFFPFFNRNVFKKPIHKLKLPILMSGYISPDYSNLDNLKDFFENTVNKRTVSIGVFPIQNIKRSNCFIKINIPPNNFLFNEKSNFLYNQFGFHKRGSLETKSFTNCGIHKEKNSLYDIYLKGNSINSSNYKFFSRLPKLAKSNLFYNKIRNSNNILLTKDYLYPSWKIKFLNKNKSQTNLLSNKLFTLQTNSQIRKNEKKRNLDCTSKGVNTISNRIGASSFRWKYVGNWSFYWNYFKSFYGSSYLLKPFSGVFYSMDFNSFFLNTFEKIGINTLIPGQNFLFEKWHPRKKEGFFYKRINKLRLKKIRPIMPETSLSSFKTSQLESNSIVELLWGFRAKYKLEEVLQYQKSKYYQSKKAQQTNNEQNENAISNNSKTTLQLLTKTLIKRKRYRKYMRFDVLSSWLRDILYFRKMSRKIFFVKKDSYLFRLSPFINKLDKSSIDKKKANLKNYFTKLFSSSNTKQIRLLNESNFVNFNSHFNYLSKKQRNSFEKLNLKLLKKKVIKPIQNGLKTKPNYSSNKFSVTIPKLHYNYKSLVLTKKYMPLKKVELYLNSKNPSNNQKQFFQSGTFSQNSVPEKFLDTYFSKNSFLVSSTLLSQNQLFKNSLKRLNFKQNSFYFQSSVYQPLILNNDSYLNIFNEVGGLNSPILKKIDLNFSHNRFLQINQFNRNFLLLIRLRNKGLFILKDFNNYLNTLIKKLKRNVELSVFQRKITNKTITLDLLRKANLKSKTKQELKKLSRDFYNIDTSTDKFFANSKKLLSLLKLNTNNKILVVEKPSNYYIFKNNVMNCFKTNLKNNWIKKLYRNSINIKTYSNYGKSYLVNTNRRKSKTDPKILTNMTSLVTKFRNFASSFAIWRNKFQIRRDYLFLSYIYLDYVGAIMNSLLKNIFYLLIQNPFFYSQNSPFILFNNFNNIQKNDEIKKIFPKSNEKYNLFSRIYKGNIIKPNWSYSLINHLKTQHFDIYQKIIEQNNTKLKTKIYNRNISEFNSLESKSEKDTYNLQNLVKIKKTELNNRNKTKSIHVKSKSPTDLIEIHPSVIFYRSIIESSSNDIHFLPILNIDFKNQSISIKDSSFKNKIYIDYKNNMYKKKLLFLKKQQRFQTLYESLLKPSFNFMSYPKTKLDYFSQVKTQTKNQKFNSSFLNTKKLQNSLVFSDSFKSKTKLNFLQPKLRRKVGLFKMRILNRKTTIYNGRFLPTLKFVDVPLFSASGNLINLKLNESLNSFLELNFNSFFNQIKISNFWLCTVVLHLCLIVSLLTIYRSSLHFCVKALYSTLFVLNKYFVYSKYRIQRLLKYIYQNNLQSIIEHLHYRYYEKYFFSFYSTLTSLISFFYQRNTVFSVTSRFTKSSKLNFLLRSIQTSIKSLYSNNLKTFHGLSNKLNKYNMTSIQFPLFPSNVESIIFFQYLIQQTKHEVVKSQSFIENKKLISKFLPSLPVKALSLNSKFKDAFRFKKLVELKFLKPFASNNNIKSEGKNLKFKFRVLRWNMFLTLLIGESEILAELEPYREMHWYFLKRFPIFLRTPAGKDSIGMLDYQADEKIRLIKQKIRQTVMILYLRTRKYESKLQNRSFINEKTNQSVLKNRIKMAKWNKNTIIIEKSEKMSSDNNLVRNQSEISSNLDNEIFDKKSLARNILIENNKYSFNSILKRISNKNFVKKFLSFYSLKRQTNIKKISTWKFLLTFLGKLNFFSRYLKLNKRFRQSMMLFYNPLVIFGPIGTIFLPYLIKSFFLVFDSTNKLDFSVLHKLDENIYLPRNKKENLKKQEFIKFQSKINLNEFKLINNNNNFSNNLFSQSLKSKLLKFYLLNFSLDKENKLQERFLNFGINNFNKHSGNINIYIRQKIQNFEFLNFKNKFYNKSSNNSFVLNPSKPYVAPLFEQEFLTNCQKILNKYNRIYLSLDKLKIDNNNKQKNASFISLLQGIKIPIRWQKILAFQSSSKSVFNRVLGLKSLVQNLSELLALEGSHSFDRNQPASLRFINFETFDPKLRYYRFFTNFSKALVDVGGFRMELSAHQEIGPLICKIYTGLFLKQSAKNYLLVSGAYTTESLLFIIQALAGEIGVKLFLEDAKRLQRIGRRGINKATKRLEKLFDIAQANTPCLVFLEDIHVIGSKTKMIKVDEEQEDEEILMRSLLSKLIYRKYHKNKSLRETFVDQHLLTGGLFNQRRRSVKPANPIPKSLVFYQLTRRRAFSNYFLSNASQVTRVPTKFFMAQKLSPAFSTNAVLIWKLFKSKIATPNKRVKESPWVHIPVDAMRSIHPLTYSIRVKVAKITLLAIFTMGTRLRLVKDLIRLFEKIHYENHNNFVVFATTNKLASMDPSLRRPGRLEEIIHLSSLTGSLFLSRSSSFQSQLDTFKTYLKDLPGFSFTFNLIDNSIFSSRLNLKEWSVINYLAEDAYQLKNASIEILSSNKLNNKTKFLVNFNKEKSETVFSKNKNKSIEYTNQEFLNLNRFNLENDFFTKLKKPRMTSYEIIKASKSEDYWQIIFANINLQKKRGVFDTNLNKDEFENSLQPEKKKNKITYTDKTKLLNRIPNNSFLSTFFSSYRTEKFSLFARLAYSQVGQSLISYLTVFPSLIHTELNKKQIFFDPDQNNYLQLWPILFQSKGIKSQNLFFNRRKTLNASFFYFFSAKVGEFLFTNPIEWNNLNKFIKEFYYSESLHKTSFLNSIHGIQQNWSPAHSFVMSSITTSCLFSKTPLITKLLRIEDVSKPRQKQFFESLNAGILFEYSNFHYRTFLKKNVCSIEEKLNILQSQKFRLNNQGRPLRKYVNLAINNRSWLFRILYTELGSLDEISLRPTSMNYYYQNKIRLKQKFKLSSYQWLNWHLRKSLDQLEEIQDIAYFPCVEKYYNPRHRRWIITNGYWGYWFTFDKLFYDNLYQQFIHETFFKVYNHFDKNRELMDYLAQLLITQEKISETELVLSFKLYGI